jgi:hypothetical protein
MNIQRRICLNLDSVDLTLECTIDIKVGCMAGSTIANSHSAGIKIHVKFSVLPNYGSTKQAVQGWLQGQAVHVQDEAGSTAPGCQTAFIQNRRYKAGCRARRYMCRTQQAVHGVRLSNNNQTR